MCSAASAGVSRGYNGSQVFNTLYATPDPSEPQHCGLVGGASYWYAYIPPADGTLTLDTIGSDFDAYLAVYTYNPPLTGYGDLIPIICDNDSAGTNGAARLEFAAPKNRQFLVVLDGINGARGIAKLNYRLDTNRPPVAPMLLESPAPRSVTAGTSVTLHVALAGSPPLHFLWRKGDVLIPGATNAALVFDNVAPVHSGEYHVIVSSHVGSPLNVLLPLRVLVPPPLGVTHSNGAFALSFPSVAGQRYFLEQTDTLDGEWQTSTQSFVGNGSMFVVTNASDGGIRFYRVRVE